MGSFRESGYWTLPLHFAEVNISCAVIFKLGCFVQKYCSGTVTCNQSCGAGKKSNSNGPLNHSQESKTINYVIQCRFCEVLFYCAQNKKNCFCGACVEILQLCAEILLPGSQGLLGSHYPMQGHFGHVQKYWFLDEIFTLVILSFPVRSSPFFGYLCIDDTRWEYILEISYVNIFTKRAK